MKNNETYTKLTGTMTITQKAGNTVTLSGFYPGAKTIEASFDPATSTLTIKGGQECGNYTDVYYKQVFPCLLCGYTDDFATDSYGYWILESGKIKNLTAKIDAKGNFTVSNWTVYEDYYMCEIARYGTTTFVAADAGVGSVEADNAPAEYYNLQGIRVDNPTSGVYVVRQGAKVSKVVL